MVRVLLASMVPCLAIGLTGLLVTSVGRLLLAISVEAATLTALGLTIAIMVVCSIAATIVDRRHAARAPSGRHSH